MPYIDGNYFPDAQPQGEGKTKEATPVPSSENNASTGPADTVESIPNDITRITVRPQPDYVNPPENTPSFRPTISGMVKGIYDSIKTWGDAIQGKTPTWAIDESTGEYHTSPQVLEKSLDLAGLAVMGPAPVASKLAEGTLGSFAGVRSATLDKTKLYKAQNMANEGAHPDEIWKETGFFKGADDRWRYEIPNDMSNLKSSGTEVMKNIEPEGTPKGWGFAGESGKIRIKQPNQDLTPDEIMDLHPDELGRILSGGQKLQDVLHNPELFKAYPFLKDVEVRHIDFKDGLKGQFNPSDNSIYMAPANPDQFLSTLQHEVQHAIQTHEGFARGGNSQMFASPEFLNKTAMFENALDKKINEFGKQINMNVEPLKNFINVRLKGAYNFWSEEGQRQIDSALKEAIDKGFPEEYIKAVEKIGDSNAILHERYRRLMGEVESRNVQARLDFDNTERFLNTPRSTEDIPRFLQTNLNE